MPDTEGNAPLGTTGLVISRTGLGTWAMGGDGWSATWGPQDDEVSVATIRRAVELGVNWIDTAAEYGLGHAEEVVGVALAAIDERDRPYVFTKCGMSWDPARPMIDAQPRSTAASVRTECEASLRRLGVDQLDLLQVHWPPTDGTAVEEYWQGLVDLRREGKIRFAGLSNHDLGQLERAEAVGHVDCLQPPLSLIDRDAADVVDWCARNGTGVIAYSPLCSGLLTGRYTVERVAALPATDWRRSEPAFTAGLAANLEFAAILAELAEEWGSTPAAVALGWVLAFDGVSGAIVGAREPEAVDGWAGQPAFRLTDEHLDVLAAALTRTGAGHGPTRPTTTRTTITPTTVTPTTVTRTTEDAAPWD